MSQSAIVMHDQPDDLSRMKGVLTQHGMRMVRCEQLQDLERHLSECRKCLVLLNLEIKGVNNMLLRRLSTACPQVRILGISGRAYHPELEQSLRSHLYAVIANPIDEQELSTFLRGVMNS